MTGRKFNNRGGIIDVKKIIGEITRERGEAKNFVAAKEKSRKNNRQHVENETKGSKVCKISVN